MTDSKDEKVIAEVFSAVGRYIIGDGELPSLSGDKHQVQAIRQAAIASRRLYESMHRENASIDSVAVMLEERRSAAENFKRVLGRDWLF